MKLVERIKNICISPKTEWPVIAEEMTSPKALIIGYVLPLAGFSALANFIGSSLIGQSLPLIGTYRVPLSTGIGIALLSITMAVVGTLLLGLIINSLAHTFGGAKNNQQAFKVAVYSYTPAWIAGVLYLLPVLAFLAIIAAGYGLYLLYLGLPRLMHCPEDKTVAYTIVVIISAIVLSIVINLSVGMIASIGITPEPITHKTATSSAPAEFDKDSPLGKLQEFTQKMEGLGKKMDAAQKQGDQSQQIALAMEGLGAMLGGGKKVEPIAIEQLKALLPETFAGLPKKNQSAEKSGALGLAVSKAKASYAGATGGAQTSLEISDMGGVSGLLGLASWINVQGEKEDEYGSEKTYRENGRMLHEKSSKNGDNEFSVVIAERFMISATAQGIDADTLKAGVMGLDLEQLEAIGEESQ